MDFVLCYLIFLSFMLSFISSQNWWNFESQINPYKPPTFTPLPNERFTHQPEINKYGPDPLDVIVDIPKAGMGRFIGFSSTLNYGYTWTQWPPISGTKVNVFLGIPYAAPPIKDQRFRVPVPAYLDTRYPWFAKRLRPACMQPSLWFDVFMPGFKEMSEDCLYLNIYYPNRTWEGISIRYPVVVHIHGGSFVYGSSHLYPGLALAAKGVVIVTFNYRLGPFGFLSTGDYASVGNYGLWDQNLVLTWVKENIEWFQGDPNQITLMGESAGAASVGLHVVSPKTTERFLFHQAIMMSGAELADWAVSDPEKVRTRYYAIELARQLGCPSVQSESVGKSQAEMRGQQWKPYNSSAFQYPFGTSSVKPRLELPYSVQIDAYAMVSCLRYQKTAEEMNEVASQIKALYGAPQFVWTPVVDGISGFLPRMPSRERELGHFSKIPLLAGVVHDEGSLVLMNFLLKSEHGNDYVIGNLTDSVVRRFIGNLLNFRNIYRHNQTAHELYSRYTWWPNLDNNTARWERLVALVSDMEINSPIHSVLKYHTNYSLPTYFYEYSYISPNDTKAIPEKGTYHGAELPFLFGFPFINYSNWLELFGPNRTLPIYANSTFSYPIDTNMSEFMMEMWTNFVKFGNPTPEMVKNISWSKFTKHEEAFLHISKNSSIQYHFRTADMAFWQHRFHKLAEPLSASPPFFYFPLIDVRIATVVLGCLLGIVLLCLVIMVIMLTKRPNPNHFRHEIRLAVPGAAPGSAFHSAFKDSFANRITFTKSQPNLSLFRANSFNNRSNYSLNNYCYGLSQPSSRKLPSIQFPLDHPINLCTYVKHPPPPPIPQKTKKYTHSYSHYSNRQRIGSTDLNSQNLELSDPLLLSQNAYVTDV